MNLLTNIDFRRPFQPLLDINSSSARQYFKAQYFAESPLLYQLQELENEKLGLLAVVDRLSKLGDDWDFEGAGAFSEGTIENCRRFIFHWFSYLAEKANEDRFSASAFIFDIDPNATGTVSFRWQSSDISACLEIGHEQYGFYLKPKVGEAILAQGNCPMAVEQILELLSIDKPKRAIRYDSPIVHAAWSDDSFALAA